MKRHISDNHHGTKTSCEVCGKVVKNYTAHLKLHDSNMVRYPCSYCPFKATSKIHAKNHEDGIHKGVRHKCQQCDYQSKLPDTLKHHIRVNHEKLRFYCDHCTLKFTNKDSLNKHVKRKHSNK